MSWVEIQQSTDGSKTLWDALHGEHFHSLSGAYGESMHVFVENGLNYAGTIFTLTEKLFILEIGFGTGLNALLTCLNQHELEIDYTGIEKYPLTEDIWQQLDYEAFEPQGGVGVFRRIMACDWGSVQPITSRFILTKLSEDILDYEPNIRHYHLIYFDAFSASVQPELWSAEVFGKLYNALKPGGLLVTYSAKGVVKQALRAVGFSVERLPGLPERGICLGRLGQHKML